MIAHPFLYRNQPCPHTLFSLFWNIPSTIFYLNSSLAVCIHFWCIQKCQNTLPWNFYSRSFYLLQLKTKVCLKSNYTNSRTDIKLIKHILNCVSLFLPVKLWQGQTILLKEIKPTINRTIFPIFIINFFVPT